MIKNLLDKYVIQKEIRRIEDELQNLIREEKAERDRFSMKILEIQAAREAYVERRRWLKEMI